MSDEKTVISLEYLDAQENLIVTTLVKLNDARKTNAMLKYQLEHVVESIKQKSKKETVDGVETIKRDDTKTQDDGRTKHSENNRQS